MKGNTVEDGHAKSHSAEFAQSHRSETVSWNICEEEIMASTTLEALFQEILSFSEYVLNFMINAFYLWGIWCQKHCEYIDYTMLLLYLRGE